jgi:hypothetical protein
MSVCVLLDESRRVSFLREYSGVAGVFQWPARSFPVLDKRDDT